MTDDADEEYPSNMYEGQQIVPPQKLRSPYGGLDVRVLDDGNVVVWDNETNQPVDIILPY